MQPGQTDDSCIGRRHIKEQQAPDAFETFGIATSVDQDIRPSSSMSRNKLSHSSIMVLITIVAL
jgi:hypothetical protein